MESDNPIKNANTKMFGHVTESEGLFNSPSSSAVSALKSKFKEISQRQSKGNGSPESLQKKSEKEPLFSSIPDVKIFQSSSVADEVSEVQNLRESRWKIERDSDSSLYCGLAKRSRMQNLSRPTSLPTIEKASKGFWNVTQSKTLITDDSLQITTKNIVNTGEEKQNEILKFRGIEVQKESQGNLQRNNRCSQKDQNPSNVPEKKVMSEEKKVQTNKLSSAKLAEGLYRPLIINKGLVLPNKEAGMDKLIVGSEINIGSDLALSPRHEQAKRLLERARLKIRFQNQNSDKGTQVTPTDFLEYLPMCNQTLPLQITSIRKQQVPLSVHLLDVQSKQSQLCSHVDFESKSNKGAEHHYLDKIGYQGLGFMDSSLSKGQTKPQSSLKVSQDRKSQNYGSVCISLSNQEDPFLLNELTKDEPKKCETCGSILTSSDSKKPKQNAKGQRNSVIRPITSGQSSHQFIQTKFSEGTLLTGNSSYSSGDKNVETARPSNAGKIVSVLGKLRRRSRQGDSRLEAIHRPYARSQDLLAHRRNSRTKSSMEEVAGPHSKPVRVVTFAIDSFIPTATNSSKSNRDASGKQLPIKSALKFGSKSRPLEQHDVKNLPLYKEIERSSHYASPQDLGAASQVSQVHLGPRYPSPVGTVAELVDGISPNEDPTCATSLSPECQTFVQGATMLKTEDLRAKPLRLEHCKDELQWDTHLSASRRTLDKEGCPKLSLHRIFSAMGLNSMGKMGNDNRSSSMEHLSISSVRVSPSRTHKNQTLLQKTPSLQAINTESPLAQLRKASSAQSLRSPKKKHERSTMLGELYSPLVGNTKVQGMENLDSTQNLGPTGRIIQTFPDGSLLLELTRPDNTPFGFVISRRKGRPDSGIYVEQVVGSTTENIYTSLLGVGDEILEVNGEKVNGLSLDQVTCQMTRESTATIRMLPHRWIQH